MNAAPLAAHVAAASLNQTVGDWVGNKQRILRAVDCARQRGARFLLLPEMCIPGYSLGDRLMMRGTLDRSWRVLEEILPQTAGMVVLVGLPVRHRDVLYNVVAVCADGRLVGLVPKENLATGDVQYENRWFSGWPRGRVERYAAGAHGDVPFGALLFEADGLGRFAVEVCEDGWKGIRPGSIAALAGAHLVANPSASWFVLGKHRVRRRMVEQISREDKVVYLYSSLLGCDATRLVFDGSVFVAQDGSILEEGRRFLFDEDMEIVDRVVDLAALQRARMEEGSWRQQVASLQREDFGGLPELVRVAGSYRTDRPPPATAPYWLSGTSTTEPDPSLTWLVERGLIRSPRAEDLPWLELELALCLGLREYWAKCGIPGFTLALSGGRDSGMVALLVQRMFRYHLPDLDEDALRAVVRERFSTAYLSTENSGSTTREAARALAEALGADHHDVAIQDAVDTHVRLFGELSGHHLSWDRAADDLPLQNVQARLRGSLIWMLANVRGHLLLATSNKSEAAVGYTTMDGDTSGGIAPIADVPKSMVSAWLHWAAGFHALPAAARVCAIPATAELRPPADSQTDEDDLMPFAVLDRLMYNFVQLGHGPLECFRSLWPAVAERYDGDPRRFSAHVRKNRQADR